MTHDFTYLNQLPVQDLIDRAARGNWTGPEAHMIRALVDRLEEHLGAAVEYDRLNDELMDANRRADNWQSEAMALMAQMKGMVR